MDNKLNGYVSFNSVSEVNKFFTGCFLNFFVDSDAHSTTSSVSPAQSPSYSNQSDDGSDIESKQRRSTPSIFSFLDRSYWKRYLSAHTSALILKGQRINGFSVYLFLTFLITHSGKRCAAALSTRAALARWLLTLGSSSLAAVPKNKRWDPHKWPHASPIRFLSSSRKMWKKTGDCFYWTPPAGLSMASAWHCLQWQTSMFLFLQWNVRFFFSIKCFFLCGYFFTFLYRGDSLLLKKEEKKKKNITGISVIYRMRTKCEAPFLILNSID